MDGVREGRHGGREAAARACCELEHPRDRVLSLSDLKARYGKRRQRDGAVELAEREDEATRQDRRDAVRVWGQFIRI